MWSEYFPPHSCWWLLCGRTGQMVPKCSVTHTHTHRKVQVAPILSDTKTSEADPLSPVSHFWNMFSRRSYKCRRRQFKRVSSISSLPLVLWRTSSAPAPLYATAAALLQERGLCRGLVRLTGGLWGAASPPALSFTPADAVKVPPASLRTPHPLLTLCPSPHRQEHPEFHFSSAQINVAFKPFLYILG